MCGQSIAYNTYATLSYTNPIFMGFSEYQNVNSSSQRDNILQFKASYGVSEKYITPQNFGSEVFFLKALIKYIIIVKY